MRLSGFSIVENFRAKLTEIFNRFANLILKMELGHMHLTVFLPGEWHRAVKTNTVSFSGRHHEEQLELLVASVNWVC